jgi:hypothetical protein
LGGTSLFCWANCIGATGTKANTQTLFSHFTHSLDFWFFASRQRTEKPTCYFLSFFSPDRKERNKEKVTAAFHPFLDGIFYSS